MRWSGAGRGVLRALALAGWSVAGILALLLIERVGWLGVAIIGAAILMVAYRSELHEENALPVPYGNAGIQLYRAQHERNANLAPEQKLARAAERSQFGRFLYLVRTAGIALILIGLNMFLYHQLR